MRDFTLTTYHALLEGLQQAGFSFQTFDGFLKNPQEQAAILRHDVDDRKQHSLEFAKIQHRRGIRGSYYFRMVPQSFDPDIILEIQGMGHEIGYHYEDMDFAKGDPHKAISFFEKNLQKLRNIVPVNTICMHGSPRSRYDNKDVWKYYNYRDYGITGEPYFDLDFSKIFYLTDTGRCWNGHKVSVRDKVPDHFGLSFHSTHDIIRQLRSSDFPKQVMFNFHPQRWTENRSLWLKEKYSQTVKNWVKYHLIRWNFTVNLPFLTQTTRSGE